MKTDGQKKEDQPVMSDERLLELVSELKRHMMEYYSELCLSGNPNVQFSYNHAQVCGVVFGAMHAVGGAQEGLEKFLERRAVSNENGCEAGPADGPADGQGEEVGS
jgi:hypothetical protein